MRQASPGELGVGGTDTVRDLLIDLLSVWLLWGGGEGDGEFSNTSQLASMVQETLVLFCDEQPYIDNFSTVCSVCLENNFGWSSFFCLCCILQPQLKIVSPDCFDMWVFSYKLRPLWRWIWHFFSHNTLFYKILPSLH